LAFIIRTQK